MRKTASLLQGVNFQLPLGGHFYTAGNRVKLISKEITALPQSGRSQKHLLKSGEPRVICCARVSYEGRLAYILEVDTSDGVSKLSSKVFRVSEPDWLGVCHELFSGVTEKSLGWPNSFIKQVFDRSRISSIHHPRNDGAGNGNVPLDSIGRWSEKFLEAI